MFKELDGLCESLFFRGDDLEIDYRGAGREELGIIEGASRSTLLGGSVMALAGGLMEGVAVLGERGAAKLGEANPLKKVIKGGLRVVEVAGGASLLIGGVMIAASGQELSIMQRVKKERGL